MDLLCIVFEIYGVLKLIQPHAFSDGSQKTRVMPGKV